MRFDDLDRLRLSDRLYVLCPAGIDEFRLIWAKWQSVSARLPCVFCFPDETTTAFARSLGAETEVLEGLTSEWVRCRRGDSPFPRTGWVSVHAGTVLSHRVTLDRWYPEIPLPDGIGDDPFFKLYLPKVLAPKSGWQPGERFEWGVAAGHWGDVMAALGSMRHWMELAGQERVSVLYLGKDAQIVPFLECQGFVARVVARVVTAEQYPSAFFELCKTRADKLARVDGVSVPGWAVNLAQQQGIGLEGILPTQPDFNGGYGSPVYQWHGGTLPDYIRAWARRFVASTGIDLVVHPQSTASGCKEWHWHHWRAAVEWLCDAGYRVGLTGLDRDMLIQHPHCVDLLGITPTNMHVLALAEAAGRVVTTSNSVAHWCSIQQIPAVVCASEAVKHPKEFYRRWIQETPTSTLLNHDSELAEFRAAIESRFPRDELLPETPTGPDTLLIQQGAGEFEALLRLTEQHHRSYCARWGIDYWPVYELQQTERHPVWCKILLIRQALVEGYRLVVWLDADCLIVDTERDLREALTHGEIGMVSHQRTPDLRYHFNAGCIWIRNTPSMREMMGRVWQDDIEDGWREQESLNRRLAESDYRFLEILHARWNSGPANPVPEPIIKAWHGDGSAQDRLVKMKAAIKLGQ